MRMVTEKEINEQLDFAKEAAQHFGEYPEHNSYTGGKIVAGCLFALRWGRGADCVLIFKLDEDFEPTNYQNIIHEQEK